MDLYRLDKEKTKGFIALNLENIFCDSVSLVEWSSRLPDFLIPKDRIEFYFSIRGLNTQESDNFEFTTVDDGAEREAIITPYGLFWERVVQDIVEGGYLEDMII
jgi:tRNA A37 threonylcarbamoyladenosine biosynthesis protein TsaE